jgi:hypothetical protein
MISGAGDCFGRIMSAGNPSATFRRQVQRRICNSILLIQGNVKIAPRPMPAIGFYYDRRIERGSVTKEIDVNEW